MEIPNIKIPKRERIVVFSDFDGVFKNHSEFPSFVYRNIPRRMKSNPSHIREFMFKNYNTVFGYKPPKVFEDMITFFKETATAFDEEIFTRYIDSLNEKPVIDHFLYTNKLVPYVKEIIPLHAKNPEIMKQVYERYTDKNDIILKIGDEVGDLENELTDRRKITLGFDGYLEKNQSDLKSLSKIYIDKEDRKTPSISIYKIYSGLEKELKNLDVPRNDPLIKGITNLKNHYESKQAE